MMTNEQREKLEPQVREALDAQHALLHAIARLAAPDWMELDLPTGQLKALVTVGMREGMTVSEVADALHIGKPAASMLIDRLVQQGYVARSEDPSDRRRAIVVPSAAGAELVERLRQGGSGPYLMARLIQQLSADDLAALTQGMRALAAVAEREAQTTRRGADHTAPTPHTGADDATHLQSTR